jgi:hypothetical protein
MTLSTTRVGSISTWSELDSPDHHATEHNALHGSYNSTIGGADFVIGAEAGGNTINVGVVLNFGDGTPITSPGVVTAFLSDDIAGLDIGTAVSGTPIIQTDGFILATHVAKLVWEIQSNAVGAFDLDIIEASTGTWYLVVILGGGLTAVSGAITFV